MHGNRAPVSEIYGVSTDVATRRRVLRAPVVAGGKDRVLAAATNERVRGLCIQFSVRRAIIGKHAHAIEPPSAPVRGFADDCESGRAETGHVLARQSSDPRALRFFEELLRR